MQNLADREFSDEYEPIEDEITEKILTDSKRRRSQQKGSFLRSQLALITQLVLCLCVIIFAVIAKTIGGTFYATVATWYFDHYNNSIFTGTKTPETLFTDDTKITETSLTTAAQGSKDTSAVLPLKTGIITSPFGEREYGGKEQFHKGIDIGADKNCEIKAVMDGTVVLAENDSSYGNYIILQHNDSTKTLYAHCEKLLVKKGDIITAGSVIALFGETGDADGPHLHLEYIKDGENVDPAVLLNGAYT